MGCNLFEVQNVCCFKLCRQISLEVHNVPEDDGTSRVEYLQKLLKEKGFSSILALQDQRMAGTNLWMVYGKRSM